ncbi:MAG: hypothetical protein ACM3O8_00005 [Methylococcaceae bacterium]|nr:hypothetical protein [Prolixibacteraceae bacterium]
MISNNRNQFFTRLLGKDQVGEPDKAIEDRLMYSFMLKNSQSRVKQNSFASFFGWAFSTENLGLKAGLISAVLFFSVMNYQFNIASDTITGNDSLFTKRVLVADSTNIIQNLDSIHADSLN